jgi:hypothetical protein
MLYVYTHVCIFKILRFLLENVILKKRQHVAFTYVGFIRKFNFFKKMPKYQLYIPTVSGIL